MWITNNDYSKSGIFGFHGAFSDYEPFEAVLLISREDAPELHRLIRKAEGPLHNKMDRKAMGDSEYKKLRGALNQIKNHIQESLPKLTDDPYCLDDVLTFPDGAPGTSSGNRHGWEYHGGITSIRRRNSIRHLDEEVSGGGSGRMTGTTRNSRKKRGAKSSRSRRRPALPEDFSAVVTPISKNKLKITLRYMKDYENVELRLVLGDSADPTTDRIWPDLVAEVTSATIDGVVASKRAIVREPYPAIRLNMLSAGIQKELVIGYIVRSAGVPVNRRSSFRVEMGRIPATPVEEISSVEEVSK